MTPCSKIYDAFLARITPDDWILEEDPELVLRDWEQLLEMAIFRFKYPRVGLEIITDDEGVSVFSNDLTRDEVQLLALYMKHEWLKRTLSDWQKIHTLYPDKDFSYANFLDKLIKLEATVSDEVHRAEGIYDRSRDKKPADLFKKLAGKQR